VSAHPTQQRSSGRKTQTK